MFSYEQLENYLYYWAHRIRKQYNDKFETDELVNEVWLNGKVQSAPRLSVASNRIRYDMLDYIRRETKSKRKHQPNVYTNVFNSDEDDNKSYFWDIVAKGVKDQNLKRVDDIDEVEYLMRFPNEREKQYLTMYYFQGKSQPLMAEELSVSETTVYKYVRRGVEACKCAGAA